MDRFTFHPGVRLELDEEAGRKDGPRIFDATAGLVRYADSSRDVAFTDLCAVALLWVEREVRVRVSRSFQLARKMVHVVALVPRRARPEVAALLGRLERGEPDPPGFSTHVAAHEVDEASIHVEIVGSAVGGRRMAKAIARLARLPVVELYGELAVYRPADDLDPSLRARLAQQPPRPDPGPRPPGLAVTQSDTLEVTAASRPRPIGLYVSLVAGLVVVSAGIVALGSPVGVVGLVAAVALAIYALRARRSAGDKLVVGRERIEWIHDGRTDAVEIGALEMMRIHDATLVLVDHDDEVRCDLPSPDAAEWTRRAIEQRIGATHAGPYR